MSSASRGYLRGFCGKTQFIVITHRRGTMEAADVLYGVTMQEQGISKHPAHLDLNRDGRSSSDSIIGRRSSNMGFFEKIKNGLKKTQRRNGLHARRHVSASFSGANDEFYEELEESMILADVGVETSGKAVEQLRSVVKERKLKNGGGGARMRCKDILAEMLNVGDSELKIAHADRPSCSSSASTASARRRPSASWRIDLRRQGKKVLLCAARYVPRGGCRSARDLGGTRRMRTSSGSTRARTLRRSSLTPLRPPRRAAADVILCDTAGRLHNKANLMNELGKISRIIDRELPDADKEVLLVLDAHDGPERPDAGQASSRRSPV